MSGPPVEVRARLDMSRRPLGRLVAIVTTVIATATLSLSMSGPEAALAEPVSLTFLPSEDAFVSSQDPGKNFGTATVLRVKDGTDDRRSLLRFAVSGLSGPIASAQLQLRVTDSSPNGGQVQAVSAPWAERTATWANQPAPSGNFMASLGSVASGTWAIADVTAAIAGDGTYAFRLGGGISNIAVYSSREGANPPRLIVTSELAPASPSPSPSASPSPGPSPSPSATPSPGPSPSPPPSPGAAAAIVGAADIAKCSTSGDEATATLLDGIAGTVFTAGDNAYPDGTATDFANCYGPSWGRHRARTRPATGNHEYTTPGATGYFGYFGGVGEPGQGWYSYELGDWHIIVLNSNCAAVGGCGPGSPQEVWLRADLMGHPATCTLAYWHHPRFSSGEHGSDPIAAAFWQALYEANADVVINGHDHDYERFAPQDPNASPDPTRGIREFVVGTGGAGLRAFLTVQPNSEVRNASTWGVLRLALGSSSYDWAFVPVAGKTFTDSGTGACH